MATEWQRRVRTYRERGSFRFNAAEREAYALILDLRVLSYVGVASESLRSVPPKGFWGNATIFERETPRERIQVEFPRFRLLNVRNEQVANTYNALAIAADSNQQLTSLGEIVEAIWDRLNEVRLAPQLRHRETVVKFQGLPLSQFEFTCYHLPFPEFDGDFPDFNPDPPAGPGDEYWEPTRNPTENPYLGNPDPSNIPNGLDPRDFSDDNNLDPDPAITGSIQYEFLSGGIGPYTSAEVTGVTWPGQLAEINEPGFINAIGWISDDGEQTLLVRQNGGPADVRFVQFTTDEGDILVPDPNAFVVSN